MAKTRSAAHIAVLAIEKEGIHVLAAAGGCYVGAPPRPRCARRGRFVVVAAKRCVKTCM